MCQWLVQRYGDVLGSCSSLWTQSIWKPCLKRDSCSEDRVIKDGCYRELIENGRPFVAFSHSTSQVVLGSWLGDGLICLLGLQKKVVSLGWLPHSLCDRPRSQRETLANERFPKLHPKKEFRSTEKRTTWPLPTTKIQNKKYITIFYYLTTQSFRAQTTIILFRALVHQLNLQHSISTMVSISRPKLGSNFLGKIPNFFLVHPNWRCMCRWEFSGKRCTRQSKRLCRSAWWTYRHYKCVDRKQWNCCCQGNPFDSKMVPFFQPPSSHKVLASELFPVDVGLC